MIPRGSAANYFALAAASTDLPNRRAENLFGPFFLPGLSTKYSKHGGLMGKLDGKVAVVTAANSGVGLATAKEFIAEGAYVFGTGRRQAELDAATKEIGKHFTGVQGDVSNMADLNRLYAAVKEKKGYLDIIFANAGIAEFAPLGQITEAHFDKTFNINVKALLFTVQIRVAAAA
jgi:NAD(P)-dependent dehydrogenase (short-subunit alcohol dehydrogenase family)